MPLYIPSITIDNLMDALAAYLQPFVGVDTEITRAQENRISTPVGEYVKLTEINSRPLETPGVDLDPTGAQQNIRGAIRMSIQVDFYGPDSGDWCSAIEAVWRTPYTANQFADGIAPLTISNGIQAPLIDGEAQYESRWTLTVDLQYNPVVSVPVQSALKVAVNVLEDLQ